MNNNNFKNAFIFILLKIFLYYILSLILNTSLGFESVISMCFFIISLDFILVLSKISLFNKYILSLDILVIFMLLCFLPKSVIYYAMLSIVTSFLFLFEKLLKLKI